MSILEKSREVSADTLLNYLPPAPLNNLPVLMRDEMNNSKEFNEREVLYKLIFEMKKEMNDLRSLVNQIMQHTPNDRTWQEKSSPMIHELETSEANNNNNKRQFILQPSSEPFTKC